MKVLVIGATGQTGRHAVAQLLAGGHEVTAFARHPAAVNVDRDHLRVAQGDARDPESIDRAVAEQDAVNVCPAPLKNAPARGGVKASADGRGLKQYMHREDLAAFMVGQLTEDTWVRKCVAIGY